MESENKKKPVKKSKKIKQDVQSAQSEHTHSVKKRRVPKPADCLPHVLHEQIEQLKERVSHLENMLNIDKK